MIWMRRALMLAVLLGAGLVADVRPVRAQAAADTAAVLLDVAAGLEREGRAQLAGAIYNLILERYPNSAAAQEVKRRRSTATLPVTHMDRGGRAELIVFGTLYGLWLGVAVPASLGSEEPAIYGLGLLAGGPGGFIAARNYAEKSLRGEGHARAITFGGAWGTWQAFGWREVLDLGEKPYTYCAEYSPITNECLREAEAGTEIDEKVVFRYMLLGGLTGIVAGDLIGKKNRITPGDATTTSLGALWGSWYGFASGVMLGSLDDDGVDDGDEQLAWILAGGDAGLVASALMARKWDWTREQARLISIAGVAGLAGGLGVDLLVQSENERVNIGIPMVTSIIGLVVGTKWASDRGPGDAGEDGGSGDALLNVERGKLGLSTPMPSPMMLRNEQGRRVPGLAIPILNASF
jgi:hypothetical protein